MTKVDVNQASARKMLADKEENVKKTTFFDVEATEEKQEVKERK